MTAAKEETAKEAEVLDALDWEPPCEFKENHPEEVPPAKWAVYFRDPQPCGHRSRVNVVLICDPCLRVYIERGVFCRGVNYPFTACVRTWEPINRGSK